MSKVIADLSVSLDGFVAEPDDNPNQLFGWMFTGDVEVPTALPGLAFRTSPASADELRAAFTQVGALLSGQRNFDLAGGWGGTHPMGVPVVVLTHEPPTDTSAYGDGVVFVTDGLERAVAQAKAIAGHKDVGVASPSLVAQCLDAGLLDAIRVNLVPVLLGNGVPFFANLASAPIELDTPQVVEGVGVTHLAYEVRARR